MLADQSAGVTRDEAETTRRGGADHQRIAATRTHRSRMLKLAAAADSRMANPPKHHNAMPGTTLATKDSRENATSTPSTDTSIRPHGRIAWRRRRTGPSPRGTRP